MVPVLDLIEWLLESDNPSVRFWTLQDLEERMPDDLDVLDAQRRIMSSPPVEAILAGQKLGGWWVEEGDMYLPK